MTGPAGAESTSAALRRVQQDLAASQADLTRVEKERDVLRLAVAVARTARTDIEGERDLARAELASALAELKQLREASHG